MRWRGGAPPSYLFLFREGEFTCTVVYFDFSEDCRHSSQCSMFSLGVKGLEHLAVKGNVPDIRYGGMFS